MVYSSELGRGELYHFLASTMLRSPTSELIHAICTPEHLKELGAVLGEASVEMLRQFPLQDKTVEEIQQSYSDLFRIPMGAYVSPFESVYLDSYKNEEGRVRQRLMGPSAMHVSAFYEAAGCDFDPSECAQMPDYIGAELAFMGYLAEQEKTAYAQEDMEQASEFHILQQRFLNEHLIRWITPLADAVVHNDNVGFYKGIARLMHCFVVWDFSKYEKLEQVH